MIKKTKLLIVALLLLFITMGAVCAQENATADDIADSGDVDDVVDVETPKLGQEPIAEVLSDDEVGNFTELAGLISGSAADSTINLTKNYKRLPSEGYSNGIAINKKLTINGNGHTIDASKGLRIFSVSGSNVVLNNITFTNADGNLGAGVYVAGSNFMVSNSTFKDNVGQGATALYLVGDNPTVMNCDFVDNKATYEVAAAILLQGNYGKIINSTFDHNVANTYPSGPYKDGGAVYVYGVATTIDGCTFKNNVQCRTGGGALYCGGFYGDLKNCIFINNTAEGAHGGGASILGHYWDVFNITFENNTAATYGGGLFYNAANGNLYNLTFNNNSAHMGGGAYLAYDTAHNTYVRSADSSLSDSRFTNNHAIYGGGAVDAISHFVVDNCVFINNTANNYGGAVSIGYSSLNNSRFIDNSASFGGAIFSYASEISNSNFTGNHADHANSIYIAADSELNNITGADVTVNPNNQGVEIVGSHDVEHMLETESGYYGFCAESYNCNPYTGVYEDSMDLIMNVINCQSVKEYLKILIYTFLDNFSDMKKTGFHNYVWTFTDGEYWNSEDPVVQNVIALYDSGFRVPNVNACKILSNGTLMYINYSSMITPSSQQNLLLFKFVYGEVLNQSFTKEALINDTVYIGDSIEYKLVINNNGTLPVYYNWIEDKEYSDGLTYQSWRAESGNWTYDEAMNRWYLDVLEPGKSASLILTFGVTLEGLLSNNAVCGVGDVNFTTSADEFEAIAPDVPDNTTDNNSDNESGNNIDDVDGDKSDSKSGSNIGDVDVGKSGRVFDGNLGDSNSASGFDSNAGNVVNIKSGSNMGNAADNRTDVAEISKNNTVEDEKSDFKPSIDEKTIEYSVIALILVLILIMLFRRFKK